MPVSSNPNERSIYAISGPTASGKTAFGVRLAHEIGGEVINFDSVQIYQGIEIATAKPSDAEKQGIPHHLIGYVDPNINYTAADWADDATAKIREIELRGSVPILVGGTGFYLRSLRQPLFESPKTDQDLRNRFQQIAEKKGFPHLYGMLKRFDPEAASRLFENDGPRITRALEVRFQTGKPFSQLQPNRAQPFEFASRIRLFVLGPPRDVLYEKINRRTEEHFARGLVQEVKQLLAAGVNETGKALGAHAYRRVCEYLRGERTLESAVEKSKQDVRNYAKRQLTWFRREADAIWLSGFGSDDKTFAELRKKLY
ncbi:MAG: tRNA (adenosine(37)-N6)-dimethylallyltransferase MiaA [Pyrinomonadaceae bacterium]